MMRQTGAERISTMRLAVLPQYRSVADTRRNWTAINNIALWITSHAAAR